MRISASSNKIILAPLAGAFAAFLSDVITAVLVGFEYVRPRDALIGAYFIFAMAFVISTFYTAIVAVAALVYRRVRRRPLPLFLAVGINAAAAAIPLALGAWKLPAAAILPLCAIVPAWIYCRVNEA